MSSPSALSLVLGALLAGAAPPALASAPPGGTVAGAAGAGVRLAEIAWTDAEPLLTRSRIVVLPLGAASKEHGPHLSLGNDAILAEYLADRVLAARPVALLPALGYGFYPAFLEYPGSVSLAAATQRDVVVEICRSMAGYGPRRFYALNTGVSTAAPLAAAAAVLSREGILLRYTDMHAAGEAAVAALHPTPGCTHADEVETSMLLYIRPGAVRMERAAPTHSVSRPGPFTRDPRNRRGEYSPSGGCGDPTRATREKGERVVEAIVADILKDIDALAAAALPSGAPASPLEPPAVR